MSKSFTGVGGAVVPAAPTWQIRGGLVALALLVMAPLAWAFWSPQRDHGAARAAVVNNDRPVTVDGRLVPVGRQLAGNLTHGRDSAYSWVLTDAADAADGLRRGTYAAAVIIPEDFSARVTSPATAGPLAATQARLQVKTSTAPRIIDPAASTQVARAVQQTLNQQVVQTYLDNVYLGFSSIHDEIDQAADGAAQLADGSGQLAPGTSQLSDATGALAAAASQLSVGADQLADGTARLADGSSQLAAGASQLERDTANLPALTRQLADGAARVAAGNQRLAEVVVPLADRVVAAIDALPSTSSVVSQLRRLVEWCEAHGGGAELCGELGTAADRLAAESEKIEAARAAIRAGVVDTGTQVRALADGSQQVADGSARLADSAPQLTGGISTVARGARQLDGGVRQADGGAGQLAAGAGQLAVGAGRVAGGVWQLNDGVGRLDTGARQLATGLADGRDRVPSYTAAERENLRTAAANPSTATVTAAPLGKITLALVVVLALWACALATYLLTPAVPRSVRTSREPTWRIVTRAAAPGVAVAVLAAVTISVALAPVLHLDLGRWAALTTIIVLAALAFVVLNQCAVAILGDLGRLASVGALVLTLATGVVSTIPGPLATVGGWLPTHAAHAAIRAVVTDAPGAPRGVAQLVAWLVVGAGAVAVATGQRRYVSGRQLRRGACGGPRR